MGCRALLQGIFPAQGSNLRFLHLLPWQVDSLPLNHLGSLRHERGRGKRQTDRLDRSREDSLAIGSTAGTLNTTSQPSSTGNLLPQTTVFFSSAVLFHLSVSIIHPFDNPGPNYKLTLSLLFLSHPANGTETAKGLGLSVSFLGSKEALLRHKIIS